MMHLQTTQMNKLKLTQVQIDRLEENTKERQQHVTTGCPWTPFALCDEIISKLPTLNGNILVVSNIEFAIVLSTKYNIDPVNITFVGLCEYSVNWAQAASHKMILQGMQVVDGATNNFLEMEFEMKFDVVIGNPPFQLKDGDSTNGKDLYALFAKKAYTLTKSHMTFITPSAWTGKGTKAGSFRKFLLQDVNMSYYSPCNFTGVQFSFCYFGISKEEKYTGTVITDDYGITKTVNTKGLEYLPCKDVTAQPIVEKIVQQCNDYGSIKDITMCGNAYVNETQDAKCDNSDIYFVEGVGKASTDELREYTINPAKVINKKLVGHGLHKLVIPGVSSVGKIGAIKYAGPDKIGGHSVKFIVPEDKEYLEEIKAYLASNVVSWLVSVIKTNSCPNTLSLLSMIPDMREFTTDVELYREFALTQDEINYIENSIK